MLCRAAVPGFRFPSCPSPESVIWLPCRWIFLFTNMQLPSQHCFIWTRLGFSINYWRIRCRWRFAAVSFHPCPGDDSSIHCDRIFQSHVYSLAWLQYSLLHLAGIHGDRRNLHLGRLSAGSDHHDPSTNAMIVILLPAMAEGWDNFFQVWKHHKKTCSDPDRYTVLLIVPVIQMILGHSDRPSFDLSYGNESFTFLHPHITRSFSVITWLVVYTPLALIGLTVWSGFLLRTGSGFTDHYFPGLFIFVTSSWWMWYYSSKSGQRAFIDLYPLTGSCFSIFPDDQWPKMINTCVISWYPYW